VSSTRETCHELNTFQIGGKITTFFSHMQMFWTFFLQNVTKYVVEHKNGMMQMMLMMGMMEIKKH